MPHLRTLCVDIRHLRTVGAGDDCRFYTVAAKTGNVFGKSLNIIKVHVLLKIIEAPGYLILYVLTTPEIMLIDLNQCGTFYLVRYRLVIKVFLEDTAPENGILWLCIEHHAVQVE